MTHHRALLALATLTTGLTLLTAAPTQAATPRCGGFKVTIAGTATSETIQGTAKDDVIYGGAGNDRINGGGGSDMICGGPGNDLLVTGTSGFSTLYGDAGNDTLRLHGDGDGAAGGDGNDEMSTDAEASSLHGGAGKDRLTGSDDVDQSLDGSTGNDRIDAGGGDDRDVHGGPGNDEIQGGGGDDLLHADDGVDTCDGGPGADTCHGGSPNGPENSPTDPDTCSNAEERVSCRQAGLPARFKVTLSGTRTYRVGDFYESVATWTVTAQLEKYFTQDGSTWYMVGPGTSGSWSAEGHSEFCTFDGSGTFDDDAISFVLRLDEGPKTYGFEWGGLYDTRGTETCDWAPGRTTSTPTCRPRSSTSRGTRPALTSSSPAARTTRPRVLATRASRPTPGR